MNAKFLFFVSMIATVSPALATPIAGGCLFDGGYGEQVGRRLYGAQCVEKQEPSWIFLTETRHVLRLAIQEDCEGVKSCSIDYAMPSSEACSAVLLAMRPESAEPDGAPLKRISLMKDSQQKYTPMPFVRIQRGVFGDRFSVGRTVGDCSPVHKESEGELTLDETLLRQKNSLAIARSAHPARKVGEGSAPFMNEKTRKNVPAETTPAQNASRELDSQESAQ